MRKIAKGILIAVGAAVIIFGVLLTASIVLATKEVIEMELHSDYCWLE